MGPIIMEISKDCPTNPYPICLYAFDFDQTIIESDPEIDLASFMAIPDEILNLQIEFGGARYMNKVLEYLIAHGISLDRIRRKLHDSILVPGMHDLLKILTEDCHHVGSKSRWIVISDSNEYFVKWTLLHRNPPIEPSEIIANPAMLRPNGQIQINQLYQKETCPYCPEPKKGICKGRALEKYIELSGGKSRFEKIIYVGHGIKDICPGMILGDQDVFYIRKGHSLERLIERGIYKGKMLDFKSKIVFFKNGNEISLEHKGISIKNTN